jgi:hypothetical protein
MSAQALHRAYMQNSHHTNTQKTSSTKTAAKANITIGARTPFSPNMTDPFPSSILFARQTGGFDGD